MSQNRTDTTSAIQSFVNVLTQVNAIVPAAVPGIAVIVELFRSGIESGKSLAEIEAEATDSMATALRTRAKAQDQMSDKP
jgi:hypothetical protein